MDFSKLSAGLWIFAESEEKFGSYNKSWTVKEQIKAAASVPGLKGLELIAPTHVSLENVREVKILLEDNGLQAVAVNPFLWTDPIWKCGALTAPEEKIRKKAVDSAKQALEIGHVLNSRKMCLWPGEDGWDYLFQVDYRQMWDRTVDCLREIAEYDPQTLIGIEYKMGEPRKYQLVNNAAKAALLGCEIGLPNVGAYLDYGHALIAREIPAESVALLMRLKRLIGVHINDNYGLEDDDLMVGSVHFWTTLEFLLALERYGYQDWISLDIVPKRESAVQACRQSIRSLENILNAISRLDMKELVLAQDKMDAVQTQQIIQRLISG
jgi:L-rhamnose isomerase